MIIWFNQAAKGSQSAKEFMNYNAELERMNDRLGDLKSPTQKE